MRSAPLGPWGSLVIFASLPLKGPALPPIDASRYDGLDTRPDIDVLDRHDLTPAGAHSLHGDRAGLEGRHHARHGSGQTGCLDIGHLPLPV